MDQNIFFNGWEPIVRIILVGPPAYFIMLAFLRLSGKRTLSKLTAFDMVISMALGSIMAKFLLTKENTLAETMAAVLCLILLQYVTSRLSILLPPFRKLVAAKATMIYGNGMFDEVEMRRQHLVKEDVIDAVHDRGLLNLSYVEFVFFNPNGQLAVVVKPEFDTPSLGQPHT